MPQAANAAAAVAHPCVAAVAVATGQAATGTRAAASGAKPARRGPNDRNDQNAPNVPCGQIAQKPLSAQLRHPLRQQNVRSRTRAAPMSNRALQSSAPGAPKAPTSLTGRPGPSAARALSVDLVPAGPPARHQDLSGRIAAPSVAPGLRVSARLTGRRERRVRNAKIATTHGPMRRRSQSPRAKAARPTPSRRGRHGRRPPACPIPRHPSRPKVRVKASPKTSRRFCASRRGPPKRRGGNRSALLRF